MKSKFDVGDIIIKDFPTADPNDYRIIVKKYRDKFFNKQRWLYDYYNLSHNHLDFDTINYVDQMFIKVA